MRADTLKALQAARAEGRLTALVTQLTSGRQALIVEGEPIAGDLELSQSAAAAAAEAVATDRSTNLDDDGDRLFVRVFSPDRRLIIIGAVHIAQALASMARPLAYEVLLIDPRDAWATPERFPEVEIDRRWPDEALADHTPDRRTAVVALTHDPKLDEPALCVALRSDAFYVGALGSRRTHARRRERLRDEGLTDDEIDRIHAPVGLDIGAVSPAEIAVSILAQITEVLRRG